MLAQSWVDFGQQERLTVRLKELIRNYPRGVGIIKEFIQNADDAGAKSLFVLLDMRTHPARHILDSRMAALLGPALLIANESVFSARDFQSIQNIGESSKTESGPKTGRFGLGFNTCYNVTDYPSFVTGEYIVCFDPHQNAIANPGGQHGVRGTLGAGWETSADWLMTFTAAGLTERATRHDGTIFRLPLRTSDQASHSDISKESFGRDAFEEIVRQLKIVGPELLLFTKHLVAIEIAELSETTGRPNCLLRIATSNSDAVLAARRQVHAEMEGDLPDLLSKWKARPASLPCTTYTHEFTVHVDGQARVESWRVTHGLFCDSKGELLLAAEAMLGVGEKAMPWAGAAAKLSNDEGHIRATPIEGRIYCGLPLTDETPLPVHINGYFDLDSSRRALSADRNIIGANHVRVDWNELLMQHGAAVAYATLLIDCVDTARSDVTAFYDLFPTLSLTKGQLLSTLSRSVYRHIYPRPVIRVATTSEPTWLPVADVWLSPDQLREPLVAERRAVADPYLPGHIQAGFEANNVSLNTITPAVIRDLLHADHDVDTPLAPAERPCLSRRDWVEDLLRYCVSDDGPLKGLPLALLADGKLHTFGYSKAGVIFSASEEQRALFQQQPHWFIDVEFEETTGVQEQRQCGFLRMGPAELIANLGSVLGKDTSDKTRKWQPHGFEAPNSEWLIALFNYLAVVPKLELQKFLTNLQRWPLIPDQHDVLHPLNSTSVPIFRPDEPIYKKLIASLELLGISFITGATSLTDSIRQFAATHPSPTLSGLTGPRLVSILNGNQALKEYASSHDPRLHDPILSFLSEDRFVAAYTEPVLQQLKPTPIFPTTNGAIVQATAPDLFVSTDYKPPSCSPSVVLLKTGPEHRWRKLLHKLGIRRLDRQTLIEQVLIPKYGALTSSDQVEVLKWIRDHLTQEVSRLDKLESGAGHRLLSRVQTAELIKCTDGQLYAGATIYDPREQLIRDVLGDRAPIPDLQVYSSADPNWITFFELLGMARSPRAQDLLGYVDSLMVMAQEGTARVTGQLIDVFEFMQKNWSSLGSVSIQDGMTSLNLTAALKNRAWLPAQRNPKVIEEFPGFTVQQDRLYRPNEIYPVRLIHQIGSVLPVLPTSREVEREVRVALDMPSQAPLEAVCRHFDHLLDLWNSPDHSGVKPERIGLSFREIYRFFGTIADELEEHSDRGDLVVALQLLRARYGSCCCIWDTRKARLWRPTDVFAEGVPFFEPRRTRIVHSEERVNAGLAALGGRTSPSAEDYLTFLNDLKSEFGGRPLQDAEQRQVLYALRHIADAETNVKKDDALPLLRADARLAAAKELLWEDTTRFRGKIDLSGVPIVHDQVPPTLLVTAGVQRMSEHLIESLLSEPVTTTGHDLEKLCSHVSATIRSFEFSNGLRRLLRHQTGLDQLANSEIISRIRVVACASIETEVTLRHNGNTVALGTCNANSFFRADDAAMFVSGSSERQVLIALAKAVNVLLHPLSLPDLSALQEVLKAAPASIDGVLNDYEVPRIDTVEQEELTYEDSGQHEAFEAEEPYDLHTEEPPAEDPEPTPEDSVEAVEHKPVNPPSTDDKTRDSTVIAGEQSTHAVHEGRTSGGLPPRIPYGSDDKPPIVPGRGTTHWENDTGSAGKERDTEPTRGPSDQPRHGIPGHRDRIVTYVEGSRPGRSEALDRSSEADSIGDAAVKFVLDFERRNDRSPTAMDHNNEGFDVLSEDAQGQARYIEVKGTDGEWDALGVGITGPQFSYAQHQCDRFWLYVVENARSVSPTVYCINDPVSLITQYRFDAGWKDLAKNSTSEPAYSSSTPVEGMRVSFVEPTGKPASGTIVKVERKGLLVRLHIRTDSGLEVKQFLNASMKFSPGD